MYNCLVQPIFDYTDTVWGGLSIGCSNSLQRLQNRAAHIIQRTATTEESFKMLGWVDLETQRKAHKCILVFKCLNELVPRITLLEIALFTLTRIDKGTTFIYRTLS